MVEMMRRMKQLMCVAGAAVTLLLGSAVPAGAAVITNGGGQEVGSFRNYGSAVCNPWLSGGFANRYIEISSPLVTETSWYMFAGVSTVGGSQAVYWRPFLQKYIGGYWQTVWYQKDWSPPQGISNSGGYMYFGERLVDVWSLSQAARGPGYYRAGGQVWWLADGNHLGGWREYRLTAGEYFIDGWANFGGPYATPVTTAYCYAKG
jgi:hypothetical protein